MNTPRSRFCRHRPLLGSRVVIISQKDGGDRHGSIGAPYGFRSAGFDFAGRGIAPKAPSKFLYCLFAGFGGACKAPFALDCAGHLAGGRSGPSAHLRAVGS